jgi:hypothetical protein
VASFDRPAGIEIGCSSTALSEQESPPISLILSFQVTLNCLGAHSVLRSDAERVETKKWIIIYSHVTFDVVNVGYQELSLGFVN